MSKLEDLILEIEKATQRLQSVKSIPSDNIVKHVLGVLLILGVVPLSEEEKMAPKLSSQSVDVLSIVLAILEAMWKNRFKSF